MAQSSCIKIPKSRGEKLLRMVKVVPATSHIQHPKKSLIAQNVDESWKLDPGSVWAELSFEHKHFYCEISNENITLLKMTLLSDGSDTTKVSENKQENMEENNNSTITHQMTFDDLDQPQPKITNEELASLLVESIAHVETQQNLTSMLDQLQNFAQTHQVSPSDANDEFLTDVAAETDNRFTGDVPVLCSQEEVIDNEEDELSDAPSTLVAKKGKKRIAYPSKWEDNKRKILRNTGQQYISKKSKTTRPARALKPACDDCIFDCASKFSEEDRQKIFSEHWEIGDVTRQREFITHQKKDVTTHNQTDKSRKVNWAYYFTKNGKEIRVCKVFFMNTLDITRRTMNDCNPNSIVLYYLYFIILYVLM
ncbi:uncharacterized protein LOC120354918 isoform X2 [Nilaparvata lugens]|uniref:uncharacterized protein LOC120354918 isoform X2 n=1 Tax=Nilaparvata lugens TaxID=108931 RepID=UPI00193CC9AA|nr:uncharacterized protein LOC120354918 isoform X2 [Nilaparvata lugens]